MADDMEVPLELFAGIPDDVDPVTKRYMRAQTVIQAAFYSMGDRDISPGEAAMENTEIEEILAVALAILLAADPRLATRRELRIAIEARAKEIRTYAEILKDAGDKQVIDILDLLRLRRSTPN